MKREIAGGIVALVLCLTATPVHAQTTVERAIEINKANSQPGAREVIVVKRIKVPHRHGHRWWKKHGYRAMTVYYDGNRYYFRRVARPGLRAIVVYEFKGQYYLGDRD
jgi:hypothetical protein